MEEKVNASLTREGAVETLDIKGTMSLTATDDAACKCRVILAGQKSSAFNFSVHPKVDKKGFENNGQLTLKDASKGFPKSKPVGILRWSMASTDDDQVQLPLGARPSHHLLACTGITLAQYPRFPYPLIVGRRRTAQI